MITIEIPEATLIDSDTTKQILIDDNNAGPISQALANAVAQALKKGAGFTIQEDSIEVNVTLERTSVTEKTETYVGR